ncbi:hypothetical protein H6G89_26955 [Oscillatoria sp. FACHB-1407]|uniref:hypothetical protein n=1 Tax=Oscillatoria sp. FACHB-1407 TaxID=2692847 RepID=UPI00168569CD|nr:hypothetical protein [Oscillatoria sp. FACHB-1407]MBD2464650.1 hypothetical protein [Oscillatoria sp. FACHB-1407]
MSQFLTDATAVAVMTGATALLAGLVSSTPQDSSARYQCDQLIEVANRAVTEVQAIVTNADPQDINAMTQIAEVAEQARESMEALELPDETLQGLQQRFVTMYSETGSASRALATAVNANNNQDAENAYQALRSATDAEAPLVRDVNAYCDAFPATDS